MHIYNMYVCVCVCVYMISIIDSSFLQYIYHQCYTEQDARYLEAAMSAWVIYEDPARLTLSWSVGTEYHLS